MNVVPSGMSLDERKSWYKAAFLRLSQLGIPADLLEQGAIASFVKADHPAKIIKLIWNEIEGTLEARKASLKSLQSLVQNANAPRLNHKPVELDPDERREVSATLGSLTAEFTKRANAERQI